MLSVGYGSDIAAVKLIFEEAFAEETGASLVTEVCETFTPYRGTWQPPAHPSDPWALHIEESRARIPQSLLEEVLQRVREDQVPLFTVKPYWSARQTVPVPATQLRDDEVRQQFVQLLRELDQSGYLDPVAGPDCCDVATDRAAAGSAALEKSWGRPAVWPMADDGGQWVAGLTNDEFLDLIEIFYDLVQRPRKSHWHDYCQEWDYSDHDIRAGRRVYLWRVNALLGQSSQQLRLAQEGEDAGLLVRSTGDEREQLPQTVAEATTEPTERARIEHANAQHRVRNPTRETRREAVRNLADVLEQRRDKVAELLGTKDENDLFLIINRFDIRHMNTKQQADFGDEFLDYWYWTLLATLNLINQLEARPATP